jgi:hypothetical protein
MSHRPVPPLAPKTVSPHHILQVTVQAISASARFAGASSVWTVYALAFGMSAAAVFFTRRILGPTRTSGHEQLVGASGIWTAGVVSQVALAPLAGLLVARAVFTAAFLINAASFSSG